MIALFMAGGCGTRLWPISREKNPKQLHSLIGKKSLMTQTIERIAPMIEPKDVWIVTNEKYAEKIAEYSPGVPRDQIIAEPFPLGTTLAVGLGAFKIARKNPDEVVLIGWADSHIGKETEFRDALEQAQKIALIKDGVILGVKPTIAATGYGYIKSGKTILDYENANEINCFEEKPSSIRASEFVQNNSYLWNTGISIWKVSKLLDLMCQLQPEYYKALQFVCNASDSKEEASRIEQVCKNLEPVAIDNAIFEKAGNLAVVEIDVEWSDIGTWSAIYDIQAHGNENVTKGAVITVDTNGCLIYANKRLITTLGVSDLIIVETDDVVLIAHKNEAEHLKELHTQVKLIGGADYL